MTLKRINESPRVNDTILFELETPDAYGCFTTDPYKVDRVTIYVVERDFLGMNWGEYDQTYDRDDLVDALAAATKAVCDNPTDENIIEAAKARSLLESARVTTTFYYKDRHPVEVVGTENYPAWLSTDTTNAFITNTDTGKFTYEWNPQGKVREGDYFICWTWTPLPDGESLSAHLPFKLDGDNRAVVTIPTHLTQDDKYEILLERYLPEMYKNTIADQDLTPETLDTLNQAVALGFTFIEDLANQIIDLFDANALHESLLMYLSNLFSMKLKSSDPTLWRRQIKEAVPLFKQKGTRPGLEQAFAQAGMRLDDFVQYWQVVSKYTWQQSFTVADSAVFILEKDNVVLPIDENNFGLWVRRQGELTCSAMPKECVELAVGEDMILRMTWVGDQLSSPIYLEEGDIIRVMYQFREIPGSTEQTMEDYVRALPLGDLRDEADQEYPPKNWNVHIISESDPLFDLLIPVRHPYHDNLIFGHVRTEFAYSENIYNMEEYNGSTRPSYDVCQIDKAFVDPCGSCLSSYYSVDVAVEELNNDRLVEAQDILREFMPFHARLYGINFAGDINEYVAPPVEQIDYLVSVNHTESVLSGQANPFFHRVMEDGMSTWKIQRDQLADEITVVSGKLGTAYNERVCFVSVNHGLHDLGVMDQNNILEILAPSPNAGTYAISHVTKNVAWVDSSTIEPLNQDSFTFHLSNVIYTNWFSSITDNSLFKLTDVDNDFAALGVKTEWDIDHTPDYSGGAWKVSIPAYSATSYVIRDVLNGALVLRDHDNTLPLSGATGVAYILLNDLDEPQVNSLQGTLVTERHGYVNLNDVGIVDVHDVARTDDYLLYDGDEYKIVEFDGVNFWIEGWAGGDVAGATIEIRRRLLRNQMGYFGYQGLTLTTISDHEAELGVIDGNNPPPAMDMTDESLCKENYLVKIGNDFFQIIEWDGDFMRLAGKDQNWLTEAAGGTVVAYSVIHFPAKEVNVQFLVFDHLDRDGKDVVVREIEDRVEKTVAIVALSGDSDGGIHENVSQEEAVSFTIQRRSGEKQQGEI